MLLFNVSIPADASLLRAEQYRDSLQYGDVVVPEADSLYHEFNIYSLEMCGHDLMINATGCAMQSCSVSIFELIALPQTAACAG